MRRCFWTAHGCGNGTCYIKHFVGSRHPDQFGISGIHMCEEVNRCAALMYLVLAPYQTRHSGASLGRVSGMRISYEVHTRCLWKSSIAVARYERTGRAQEAWQRIPPKLQHYMLECERRLTDIMVHGRPVPFVGL